MEHIKESHFFQLPCQGNIYTMTYLPVAKCPCKLLVASLKRDVFCIEYQETAQGLPIPTAKEVSFTYIPSGAEIVSIDAFNKSATRNEFVIGVTIIKNSNNLDSLEFYLNIYSEWEETDEFNIENIAQNCLNVELAFTPYQLTHTDLVIWKDNKIISKEIVFLLSGSDNQVHIYREYATDHLYKEIDNKEYFPEFAKTPSPVVWVDIYFNEAYSERFTVMACECGYVRFTKVCLKSNKLVQSFSTKLNNYISHISIYAEECSTGPADQVSKILPSSTTKTSERLVLNVVVVNTILPPILFQNVLKHGLSDYLSLPRHDDTCILTCCQIADIDFDGEREILIGTSTEEVLVYKKDPQLGWCLEQLKLFSSPIISLKYIDIIEDGVNELIVMSLKGVHFLQHEFSQIQRILNEKLDKLTIPNIAALKM